MRHYLGNYKTKAVLDVGAGSGVFAKQLLDHDICESAICVDPNYEKEWEEKHNSKSIYFRKNVESNPQTLILMMDVLEHVEDDIGLLRLYAEKMPADARILITVPAFQFVWSKHDTFLEHFRRYTIKSLNQSIKQAGLRPIKCNYFFGTLFPAVAIARLSSKWLRRNKPEVIKSDLKILPEWINTILIFIHSIETHILFRFNKAFGLSVFCLCEKIRTSEESKKLSTSTNGNH